MSVFKRGGVYYYEFTYRGQRVRESTGLTNKTAASRAETLRKADLLEGRARIECPPFDSFVANEFFPWAEAVKKRPTAQRYVVSSRPLVRFLKKTRLDQITAGVVENFKIKRRRECSAAGVNRDLAALRHMLNLAIKQSYLRDNPVGKVEFLGEGPGPMRILSFEEEALYLAHCPQRLRDISVVMLNTGMRPAEVYAIRREDVHPEFIFIPRGKTHFARRTIPLTEQSREVLFRGKQEATNGWLFPHRTNPDRHMTISRSFLDITRGLSLDFRLYDLRHTFGSRAAMAGVDLPTLKELLGHSTISMTMRYVHPSPEHKIEALRKLEMFQGTPKITPTHKIVGNEIPVNY